MLSAESVAAIDVPISARFCHNAAPGMIAERLRFAHCAGTTRSSDTIETEEPALGNRLTKIYTRTGDEGSTGLGDGTRVQKDSLRVTAYGTTDELNSVLGMVLALPVSDDINRILTEVQHHLFDLGGELCIPGHVALNESHVNWLERQLDALNENLPVLKDFILPGGGPAAATCHLARTVCRRAERCVISLGAKEELPPQSIIYLNRLSDLLFVIARVLARNEGGSEVLWQSNRPPLDET